jgi:hypothetical protein
MTRPKNLLSTTPKTWMFYDSDINELLSIGKSPKEILQLGLMAFRCGWTPAKDNKQIDELNQRISKMALVLDSYSKRFEKLCSIVEKGLDIRINDDLSNIEELTKKIDRIYFDKQKETIKKER